MTGFKTTLTGGGATSIEMGIWHNGRLQSGIFSHLVYAQPGMTNRIMVPMRNGSPLAWSVGLQWDGEPVSEWWAYRVCLFDESGSLMTPELPGMLLRHPWSIYSTTILPSRSPFHEGMFTVGLRVPGALGVDDRP